MSDRSRSERSKRRSRRRRKPRRLSVQQSTVIPISLAAGLIAGLTPAAPTGQRALDVVYVVVGVGLVTWIAASAPWWGLLLASALTVVVAGTLPLVLVALIAFGLAVWIGAQRGELTPWRALTAGIALNVMIRGELGVFFGASAIVSMLAVAFLVIGGSSRRRSRDKAIIASIGSVLAIVMVGSTLVFVASVFSARNDLTSAANEAQTGLNILTETQNVEAAGIVLDNAALRFSLADRSINSLWSEPARLVPIIAQHRRALVSLSSGATAVSRVVFNELDGLNLNRLRPSGGTFDLEGFEEANAALQTFVTTSSQALAGVEASESPWLAPTVRSQLDRFETVLGREQERSESVLEVMEALPAMLGGEGPRRYLILFTTPAEARGHGGFMGNYAEMTLDAGRIEMTVFGRTGELNAQAANQARVTGPIEWLNRYGRYGYQNGPDGTTGGEPWSNITASPNFPSTAQVAAELYPQSGGAPVDGVMALDVDALAALMSFVGAVEIVTETETIVETEDGPEIQTTEEVRFIWSEEAREFLLFEQYRLIDDVEREDLLAVLAEEVFTRLAQGGLGSPLELYRLLGPLVAEGRLTVWMADPAEQELMARHGVDGALAQTGSDDAIALAFNNGTGSKLELFLESTMDYRLDVDSSGFATGEITLMLRNTAPTSGWSDGVIGNYVNLPVGTNRLLVTLFTRLPPVASTLDGEDEPADLLGEAGYYTTSWFVIMEPGQTRTLTLEVAGPIDPEMESITVRTPAAVRPVLVNLEFTEAGRAPRQFASLRPGTIVHALR